MYIQNGTRELADYFAIYGLHGRVGSCWLAELLSPACLLEPREIWQPSQRSRALRMGVTADPYASPAWYLRQFCDARGVSGARSFPHYLPAPSDTKLVQGLDKVIFLYRRNVTEQMVSLEVAKQCGWMKRTEREPQSKILVSVDQMIETFEEACWRWSEAIRHAREMRIVAYEDIADRASELREFVGLDPELPTVKLSRVQRGEDRYRSILANYDEVNEKMGRDYGTLFGAPGEIDPAWSMRFWRTKPLEFSNV